MERVYSVAEITEQQWLKSKEGEKKMNRSESEWFFQKFIQEQEQEAAAEQANTPAQPCSSSSTSSTSNSSINLNDFTEENYQALLKAKLDLACTAFAMSRGSLVNSEDPNNGAQTSELGLLPTLKECGPSGNDEEPSMQKKPAVTIRATASGSSDDEEVEGDINMNGGMNPSDAKRDRRMLSNRESARRSRSRKQAQLTELETQVSELRDQNSSLSKRLTDVTRKHNDSAVDNRILNAELEALRAKVKMAEETVIRLTGSYPTVNAMSNASSMRMSLFDGSPSDASVPVHEDPNNHFFQPTFNNLMSSHDMGGVNNGLGGIFSSAESVQKNTVAGGSKIGPTNSLPQVASLEYLQNWIRGGAKDANDRVI